ncbi:MAG: trehalase family glycosidase, partial [Pyrinomonadaceae bacterium]
MTEKLKARKHFLFIITLLLLSSSFASSEPATEQASAEQLRAIQKYIKQSWHTLTRSSAQLAKAAPDPKFKPMADGRWPVYVSRRENLTRIEQNLRAQMSAEDFATIDIRQLPNDVGEVREHGLLYLPHPYVVPGGRFNEMYGWDSYFTQVGLVRDNEMVLAKNMVDNFLYQIDHYGKILNANRTYYLTRSQPPFLTQMILNVYRHNRDREWLRRTVPAIEKYYQFWNADPHLVEQTGLA